MSNKSQPEWHVPENNESSPTLKLYNSLTRSKINFVPKKGKQITWYNCGPTVYDYAHIDIIRRVLSDYFNYDVLFVMNITDIDDKIILRARQNYLFNNFKSTINSLTKELIDQVKTALNDFARSKLGVVNDGSMLNLASSKDDPRYLLYANTFRETLETVVSAECSLEDNDASQEAAHQLLDGSKDVVSSWLDKEKGTTVTDQKVFRDLAAYWEQDFMKDMELLNVRPCDILTRVSEYIPEIVAYVQKIIENGYGYVADGSVYFDTKEFDAKKDHHYAKLQPWSAGNEGLIEEGEGSLGSKLLGKKNKCDFALWKKSKPGEPSWESPWGPGRPGWHIECSVMASEILGENMDIHSGGIDLAFPHHDNELAQSEAYHECQQWVNYFLHVGHLHVEGQKMSKSLKNFITIQQALKKYTPRQLRLCFLLQQWDSKLDFKENIFDENFFVNTKAFLNERKHNAYGSDGTHRYRSSEREIINLLREKQTTIHEALCDSINTPSAMSELMELINRTNIYLSSGRNNINANVLENIAKYVTRILKIFGVTENPAFEEIGFGISQQQNIGNMEDIVLPYLRVLSGFRDNVRNLARQQKSHSEFLALSDKLRDIDLVELGVSLDDQEDGKALVKLVDKNELIKAREDKLKVQAEKAAKKEAAAKAKEEERQKRLEKGKLAAEDMFKDVKGEDGENAYSAFDEQGIPTLDGQGQELPKNRIKKFKKEWEAQKKLHTEYLAWVQEQGDIN
ncbi:2436_t:CDS:10 [Funneliformis mosseae]|uniref:cysteine--tRNA ligase n=1 Tax=Funneliformis mosseae TaxID=27381 RepID=A0A9N8YIU3_FUNMO|nr:2436_t:CDS:10 [Funneliformis mosseae]